MSPGLTKTSGKYVLKKKIFSQKQHIYSITQDLRGRRGHDRMVVGFTTTYAISTYHHRCCEFESRSGQGVQHYIFM